MDQTNKKRKLNNLPIIYTNFPVKPRPYCFVNTSFTTLRTCLIGNLGEHNSN